MNDPEKNGQYFSAFIDPNAQEQVSDDNGNTIYIRAKMSLQVRGRVQRALASYRFAIDDGGQVDQTHTEIVTSPQEQRLIMLQANIVGWDGPAFQIVKKGRPTGKKVPVTQQNIAKLDPDWELVEKTYERIQELNEAPEIEDPEDETIADPLPEAGLPANVG